MSKKEIIRDAPWTALTYRINGLAMAVHNELGPGHREWDYHRALAAKLEQAGLAFVSEPDLPVTLRDGTVVGGNYPDLVVENTVIVELKAHSRTMSKSEEAQIIGYFAVLPQCPVALYLNFGRRRLEHRRLLPPKSVRAYQYTSPPSAAPSLSSTTTPSAPPPVSSPSSATPSASSPRSAAPSASSPPSAAPSASSPPSAAPSASSPSSAAPSAALDHIGIVVRDIQAALQVYRDALGLPLKEIVPVPDQKVEVAFLPLGESNIELVQPTSDDTGIAKFLAKRGEGIHHICIEVEDIEAALARLKEHEVQLIDEEPRQGAHGRVAFIHPKAMHGVLIELVEHPA